MDFPRQHRRLVALALPGDGSLDFARWVEALAGALAGASLAAGIATWRIVVTREAALTPEELARASRTADDAGGALEVVPSPGPKELGDRSRTSSDADIMLLLSRDALVLPSSIVRLIRAHDATGGAVAARRLPIGDSASAGDQMAILGAPTDLVAPVVQPEAVVACVADVESPDSGAAPGGSLIEEAVRALGSSQLADPLIDALTTPRELFLSIVMRTQLRRPEALREVLLCLAAQADARFELLLVVHDRDVESADALLSEQPRWLRERSQVLEARGGTRSRPLNVGLAAARGTHVAILDDDDVVTSQWVSSFLAFALTRPRQLLRAVVGVQHAAVTEWPGGILGHAAVDDVSTPYPASFDLMDHLRVNMSPFMAFAFPRAALDLIGGADEELEVCEDWDLVLRVASLLGVSDIPQMTAIYRRWISGGDSYSGHDDAVWQRDMGRVRARIDSRPLVMPSGSAAMLAEMSQVRQEQAAELAALYASTSWRLTAPLRAVSRRTRWRFAARRDQNPA